MSKMGKNLKITIAKKHREAIYEIFTGPLAAERVMSDEGKDIYRVEDGNVGFFFADESVALNRAQARVGTWLEFLVTDPGALKAPLLELGAELVEYTDKDHDYYALPGGQITRLARSAS